MSWLNLNQSLNSLKGQLSNFATEVLAEGPSGEQDSGDSYSELEAANVKIHELSEKCRNQEDEISALKKLNSELQTSLQAEKLSRKNGLASGREEEGSWYWDPPPDGAEQRQIEETQNCAHNLKDEKPATANEEALRAEIERLKKENENLSENIEDLDSQHQLAMERLLTLKKELQKNFEILRHEHDDLKSANYRYNKQVEELTAKLDEKDDEMTRILEAKKSEYETLHHKYMNLERVHSLLQETTEKFQEENQELHEEIFKLQEELTKREGEDVANKHSTDMIPRTKYEDLLKELVHLQEYRRNAGLPHLDDSNIDDNAKSVIETLKRDIAALKHKLNDSDTAATSSDRYIDSDKLLQIYNKYVNFDLPIDFVGDMPSASESNLIYKIENAMRTLNIFKKEIEAFELKMSERTITIKQLQGQVDDLSADNDYLTADLQQCERDLSEMKKNNDYLLSEITTLKNASKLEPIIESHEDNIVKLETELADCNQINKTFEKEIETIQNELSEVKNEKTSLQADLKDLRHKYNEMIEELDTYKQNSPNALRREENSIDNESLRRTIDELKRKLTVQASKNEQLSIDHSIAENDKVLLTNQVDELTHQLEEKVKSHKELNATKAILEQKLYDAEIEIVKMKAEVERDRQDVIEKLRTLASETENLEHAVAYLNNLGNSPQDVDKHIAEISSRLLKYKTKDRGSNAEQEEVQKLSKSIMEGNEEIVALAEENSALKENIEKLNKELQIHRQREMELTSEIADLISKINLAEEKLVDHDICVKEIEGLRQDKLHLLKVKTQIENELTLESERLASVNAQVETLVAELNTKENKIQTLISTIESDNTKMKILKEEISCLKKDIDAKEHEIKNMNSKLESVQMNIITHDEEINNLYKTIDMKDKEIDHLNSTVESSKANIIIINEELSNLKKTLDLKDQQVNSLLSTMESSKVNTTILDEDVSALSKTIEMKDQEINCLNSIIESNRMNIVALNEDISGLKKAIEVKDAEINSLHCTIESSKLKTTTLDEDVIFLKKTIDAKDQEIKTLISSTSSNKVQVKALEEEINNLKKTIQTKDEAINELNIVRKEINQKVLIADSKASHPNEDYAKLVQEKNSIQTEIETLIGLLAAKEEELHESKNNVERITKELTENQAIANTLTSEKAELINFITVKHNESIQYHNEIQRLNQIIMQHSEEHKTLLDEWNKLRQQMVQCGECEKLRNTLRERDEKMMELNQYTASSDTMRQELESSRDLIRRLTERCEEMDKSLTIQLDAVKRLTMEKVQLSEREQSLTRELERLRQHLAESEESHTQELLASEQRLAECRNQLLSIEERAKQTGTVYTSNSIRTQQELETLRAQLRLLERQREEAQARLSEAEDGELRSRAALANLQSVLEQFQSEKERDIESATEKLRARMEDMRRTNVALRSEIDGLNAKLEESMAGLKAASRLGEQLETKSAALSDYREQVKALQESVRESEERYQAASRQQERVDKGLVKNLLLNYLQAADKRTADKLQVLRILSTVLDFNQWECERVGLAKAAPTGDSLAREFVKFLEKESRPSAQLPNMMGLMHTPSQSSRSATPLSRKNSELGPQPTFLEMHNHKRQASTGSNNVLFQSIDQLETSSQVSLEAVDNADRVVPLASQAGVTPLTQHMIEHSGVNQTRNSEGAILKHVLKDM